MKCDAVKDRFACLPQPAIGPCDYKLTGSGSAITWNGGGSHNLTASKSGMNGGANSCFEGIVCLPDQKLEVTGSGTVSTKSPFTSFIANSFLFNGGSTLEHRIDPAAATVPIPSELHQGTRGTMPLN